MCVVTADFVREEIKPHQNWNWDGIVKEIVCVWGGGRGKREIFYRVSDKNISDSEIMTSKHFRESA